MNRKVLLVSIGVVLVTLLAACGNLPAGQAAPQPVFAPPETIDDFEIQETVDLEEVFRQTYTTQNLPSHRELDMEKIGVKFMSWSPDGQHALLQIATGEAFEGKYADDPPGMGIMRIGDYDLWLADNKGMPKKQLASSITWTAWSPNSKAVAYVHRQVIKGIFVDQLWVVDIDNNKSTNLSVTAYQLSWLDNRTLLFAAPGGHLQTIDVETQEVQPFEITGGTEANPKVTHYELSPNREWLVFDGRGDANLTVVAISDGNGEIVARIATPDLSPLFWAPNSQIFAFDPRCHPQRSDPACKQIHIAQTDGTIVAQIELTSNTDVAWSPNSKLLLFRDKGSLYLGEVATQQTYALPVETAEFIGVSWSPDGQFIAYNRTPTSGAMLLTLVEKQ
ncbi:MAG: hypothetical protein GVY30_04735 [Chloroflexi bacterium]|jgi:dipeptidyl aminopeptidase/acylaminoacyl peptidase|nr:hypothetical protein [Chloroflexota bacterium]